MCFTDVSADTVTPRSTLSSKHFSLISSCTAHELIQPRAMEGQESELCHTLYSAISLTYLSGRVMYRHVWFQLYSDFLIKGCIQNWRLCGFYFMMIWINNILIYSNLFCSRLAWVAIYITPAEANGCHQYKFLFNEEYFGSPKILRNPSSLSPILSLQLHITTMNNSLRMSRQTTIPSALIPLCQPRHKPTALHPNSKHEIPNALKVNTIVQLIFVFKSTQVEPTIQPGQQGSKSHTEWLPKFLTQRHDCNSL